MPKPRTPTALLELNGALSTNPGRYADRASEPVQIQPIGSAPAAFSKVKRSIWDELCSLVAPGVLQRSDRILLELVTHLVHDLRTGQSTVSSIGQLRLALAQLGMTPSDRSRVSAIPQVSTNDPLGFLD